MLKMTTDGGITPCVSVEIDAGRPCFVTLRAGPLWGADGTLLALELLSDVRDREGGERLPTEAFFAQAPAPVQLCILSWQLNIVREHQSWFRERKLRVSVNLTRSLAISVLINPEVSSQIRCLRDILRLELSEYFITPGVTGCDALVEGIGELAPLWLDDFGCGTTPYDSLTEGKFEAVKVDRCFVERLHRMSGGTEFLHGLGVLMAGTDTQLIAEGISDRTLWNFVRTAGVSASQGWLWPEATLTDMRSLPARLPD